jgi:lipopolysaccharide/colanic/teichoic acid biosynthesis glycosyltransferase
MQTQGVARNAVSMSTTDHGQDEYEYELVPVDQIVSCFRYRVIKRTLDILCASFFLMVFSPLVLILGLLIKLSSPGPIFYHWNVVGRGGRFFRGYKLRTMVQNADEIKEKLWQKNEMTGPVFKMKRDPRITPLGRFLRKYSLDEMPQFWSVIKGDMSLVGPRPVGPQEWVKFEPWQRRKLSVTPGLSCLWQINGRNAIDSFDDWVRLDLAYIDNWSLRLDFKILWGTLFAVLRGTGV